MEDRRAHERITEVETVLDKHLKEHSKFERALAENVKQTTQIAANTSELASNTAELIAILKNVKGLRTFIVWATPIAFAIGAIVLFIKGGK